MVHLHNYTSIIQLLRKMKFANKWKNMEIITLSELSDPEIQMSQIFFRLLILALNFLNIHL